MRVSNRSKIYSSQHVKSSHITFEVFIWLSLLIRSLRQMNETEDAQERMFTVRGQQANGQQ